MFKGCSVFCEMVLTPEQARRQTVMACQAAMTRRGVAVLVLPVDVADSEAESELPYSVHTSRPVIRPSERTSTRWRPSDKRKAITMYAGAGCFGAHDQVVELRDG